MAWTKCVVVLAALTILFTAGCSEDAEGDDRGDAASVPAAPSQTPSVSERERTTAPSSGSRLVVLGDSNAHPSSCSGCQIFPDQVASALGEATGSVVQVVNLAWEISHPKAAEVADILEFVKTDDAAREELGGADAVLILVAQNDLAYNRLDDPCGVAPAYPRIRWNDLTHGCMDATLRDYERDLESLLDEIDRLRAGRPTMIRIVTALNTAIGDLVDPTWDSPAAVEPTTYNVSEMVAVQCRLAERHDGACADVYRVLNGPGGKESAQRSLSPWDATHLAQPGHDAVAEAIVDLGFQPLVAPRQQGSS